MSNVIDLATGWKVDLIVRHDRPFSRAEFERRRPVQFGELTIDVATAEDVVLSKLEWVRMRRVRFVARRSEGRPGRPRVDLATPEPLATISRQLCRS